jgi:methylmalonyl-CoA mutase cobalamin-binding domain/chain
MNDQAILEHLKEITLNGDPGSLEGPVREAIESGIPAKEVLDYLITVMDIAEEKWDKLEIFLPEVVRIGEVMKEGILTLKPYLENPEQAAAGGKIVLGTVEGDIHDIGRNVVATMLTVNGFDVVDLGHGVTSEVFLEEAQSAEADIIALSALMSNSMPFQEDIIMDLDDEGLRERFKVMIGGGPVTAEWAREIGADGYGRTALNAVSVARRLMDGDAGEDGLVEEGALT